jgi:hypothetical protein
MPANHTTQSCALLALGFDLANDGTLVAPSDSAVTLTPIGNFFELRIISVDGNAVTAVLSKAALKFSRAGVKL